MRDGLKFGPSKLLQYEQEARPVFVPFRPKHSDGHSAAQDTASSRSVRPPRSISAIKNERAIRDGSSVGASARKAKLHKMDMESMASVKFA